MTFKDFFAPTWKKLGWFFLVFFVAQLYAEVVMFFVPGRVFQEFINFVLNPGSMLVPEIAGGEKQILLPVAMTISAMWNYFLATLLAREISKEKE